MKKSIIIETLQWTLEATMQEWLNTKKELAEVRIELEETQEALNTYKNMSVKATVFNSFSGWSNLIKI